MVSMHIKFNLLVLCQATLTMLGLRRCDQNRPTESRFGSSWTLARTCYRDSAIGSPSFVSSAWRCWVLSRCMTMTMHVSAIIAGPEVPGGTAYSINPSLPTNVSSLMTGCCMSACL